MVPADDFLTMLLPQFLQAIQESANDKWQHQDYWKSDQLPGRIRMILSYGVPCGKPVVVKPLSTEESTSAASAVIFDATRQFGASPSKNLPPALCVEFEVAKDIKLVDPKLQQLWKDPDLTYSRDDDELDQSTLIATPNTEWSTMIAKASEADDLGDALKYSDAALRAAARGENRPALTIASKVVKAMCFYRFGQPERGKRECLEACELTPDNYSSMATVMQMMLGSAQEGWLKRQLSAESVEKVLTDRIDIVKHILNQQKLKYRGASVASTADSETADLMRFLVYKGELAKAKKIATGSPKLEHLYQEIGRQEYVGKVSW